MRNKLLFVLLYIALPNWAQIQKYIPLNECINRALEVNYGIRIARNNELIDKNNLNYGQFMPTLSAEGTQKQSVADSKRIDANGNSRTFDNSITDNYGANVNLNWRLFDGLAMFTTHTKYKQLIGLGELKTRLSVENLVAQVNMSYYNILAQSGLVHAATETLKLSSERYRIAKQKNAIGSLSGLELKQTKIDLNSDSSKLVNEQEKLRNAYIQMNILLNQQMDHTGFVSDTIELNPIVPQEEIRGRVLQNNTSLLIARKEQRISELDVKLARSALYPSLDFTTGYTFSRSESPAAISTFNESKGPFWGFTVKVPLFSRMDNLKKIKNAKILMDNTQLSYQEIELQTLGDLAELYNSYTKNLLMVDFEAESAKVAYETMNAALDRYRLGNLSGIEFREFQRSYIDAVTRKLTAQFQAKVTEVSLALMSGSFSIR